jgi:hypothetical protein
VLRMLGPMPRDHGRAGRLERGGRARGHLRPTVRVRLGKDSLALVSRCGQVRATGGRSARSLACTPNDRLRGRFGSQTGLSAPPGAAFAEAVGGRHPGDPCLADPSAEPPRIEHDDATRSLDRKAGGLGLVNGPHDLELDLCGEPGAMDGPDQAPSTFPRSSVFSIASSLSALEVRSTSSSFTRRTGALETLMSAASRSSAMTPTLALFGRTSSRAVAVFPQRY